MIKPLQIGNIQFSTNLIQGPLAGVSCAPFRMLASQYARPAFSYTEMISCKTLLHRSTELQHRFTHKDPSEGPVCFQLASADPHELGVATRIATDLGADLIDLNCGCPVKKIRSKGAGSKLLSDLQKLSLLVNAMKQNTHVPVSLKIRVSGASPDQYHQELMQVIKDTGVDFLVVHGRHWTEHYETRCHYEQIQEFVAGLSIPVIGNGDVACLDSLSRMSATGCAGIMISRAVVGQPWLFAKLAALSTNQGYEEPTLAERGALYVAHIQSLANLVGSEKLAVLQARSVARYYARGMSTRDEFCAAVHHCETLKTLSHICEAYFP